MDQLVIDGAHGEGGGQILRTAVTLSVITQRPIRIENIRAHRRKPGLAAQHLTALRAAGALCGADMRGASLGSMLLELTPGRTVHAGVYAFDVGEARPGGSAGAAPLVLQTILLPLALARGASRVTIRGGTHMPWAPFYDYVAEIWLPALERLGVRAETQLVAFGWYPIGRGEITASIEGSGGGAGNASLSPLRLTDRGALAGVDGRAMASSLPAHVADRMAGRARERLADLDPEASIACVRPPAACPGAAIFLTATYASARAGFSASGERGKPAEAVADEAVDRLLAHHRSGAALDEHLADQILAPLCFASGASTFTTERLSPHLRTNAWAIEQFGLARVTLEEARDGRARVTVDPTPTSRL